MFFFDPYYLLFMLPAILLMVVVQRRVQAAYQKWSQVPSRIGLSGSQVAERLISRLGLSDVKIETIEGKLTDHYDPSKHILRLSAESNSGNSLASLAIVAHELGHAMQERDGYLPLKFRSALVPAVNIGSNLGWILIIGGLLLRFTQVAWLGVVFFGLGAIFSLATLPVEFNASKRALALLTESGYISSIPEEQGVRSVLNAAALTYVAGLAAALLQLLYFVFLVGGIGRRRN